MDVLAQQNAIYLEALNDIFNASRDDGLAAMCNWMRSRALAAVQEATSVGYTIVPPDPDDPALNKFRQEGDR
jgi:hypothetical protein